MKTCKQRKILSFLLVFVLLLCSTAFAYAEEPPMDSLTDELPLNLLDVFEDHPYMFRSTDVMAFSKNAEDAPSDAEIERMLNLATLASSGHGLATAHFVVIRDVDAQEELLAGMSMFVGEAYHEIMSEGTVMILVFADGLQDAEHHEEPYDDWYNAGIYPMFDAGIAVGELNVAAASLGYGTHPVIALNVPIGGEIDFSRIGDLNYLQGDYMNGDLYLTSKDGSVDFTHTIGQTSIFGNPKDIIAKGNLTLLAAVIIGTRAEAPDAVSSATQNYPADIRNYNFWDPQDGTSYGNAVPAGERVDNSINQIDFTSVPDGTYYGTADDLHGKISLSLAVENGKVTAIEVDDESRAIMISSDEQLIGFFESILKAQSLEVDGISGATTETKALKDAITEAIQSDFNG